MNLMPDIKVMHGVCVYGPQAATVSPESQGQVHFDLDLATESGAERFQAVEIAEHVEQMCRELVPDLAFLILSDQRSAFTCLKFSLADYLFRARSLAVSVNVQFNFLNSCWQINSST